MGEMLTPERMKAIKERCERATPGPWEVYVAQHGDIYGRDTVYGVITWRDSQADDVVYGPIPKLEDASFIAHAREDVPALVDEVERWWAFGRELRNEIRRWRYAAEEMQGVAQAHRGNWCDVAFPEGKAEGLLEAASIVEEMLNKLEARQHAQ